MAIVLKSNVKFTGDISALPRTYEFDSINDAISMVGNRRLKSNYKGAIMRVARTDNAELDIFSLKNGKLDTSSLLAFAGSNSARVVRLYDQSGKGNNFEQTSTGLQPIIVLNGVLQTASNGDACINCAALTGATKFMRLARAPSGTLNNIAVLLDGAGKKDLFNVIDSRSEETTMFRLREEAGSVEFLYRNTPSDSLHTLNIGKAATTLSRYYAAIKAADGIAVAKSVTASKSEPLSSYSPITTTSAILLGSSSLSNTGANLNGYITTLIVVNNTEDSNKLAATVS